MCLQFCEKCNSIMVLKEKSGGVGKFVCRHCHSLRDAAISKIEITERIEPPEALSFETLMAIKTRSMF